MIDLGEVSPETGTPSIPLNVPLLTRSVLAILAVAGVLVLNGSARPAARTARPIWPAGSRPC